MRFTGARTGDVIVGINEGQTKGVRLRVVDGSTDVCGKAVDKFGEEAVTDAYAKWFRLSKARARQTLMDRERDQFATHHALGQACTCDYKRAASCQHEPGMRFVIVEPGMLQESAALVRISLSLSLSLSRKLLLARLTCWIGWRGRAEGLRSHRC